MIPFLFASSDSMPTLVFLTFLLPILAFEQPACRVTREKKYLVLHLLVVVDKAKILQKSPKKRGKQRSRGDIGMLRSIHDAHTGSPMLLWERGFWYGVTCVAR
jgi:hypothetical protein